MPKTKLNISLDDLKVISTALLQYRRNLAKIGENEKAEGVARIDKQFYELINEIEAKMQPDEDFSKVAAWFLVFCFLNPESKILSQSR